MLPRLKMSRKRGVILAFLVSIGCLSPMAGASCFTYDPIPEPIISAWFEGDFAALVAHRSVFGFDVNRVRLLVPGYTPPDLSSAFFGSVDYPGPPDLNMAPLETGVISAPIPVSFFPALAGGRVGYDLLFTDTDDGLFAVDFLGLHIETATQVVDARLGENNGFGLSIPIPDAGLLPSVLPLSIPAGATGTGFDESIGSLALYCEVPEPGTPFLVLIGAAILAISVKRQRARRMFSVAALCIIASTLGLAKTVVCISAGEGAFLNHAEGWAKARYGAPDVVRTGGALKGCLDQVQPGDAVIVFMQSNLRYQWVPPQDPGNGTPVPRWNDGVSEVLLYRWPDPYFYPEGGWNVSLADLRFYASNEEGGYWCWTMGLDPTVNCLAYSEPPPTGVQLHISGFPLTQEVADILTLNRVAGEGWLCKPNVERDRNENQMTAAQRVLDKFGYAGGSRKYTIRKVTYVLPDRNGPPLPSPPPCGPNGGAECSENDPCATLKGGRVFFSLIRPRTIYVPDKLQATGPAPNPVSVGTQHVVTAIVSAQSAAAAGQIVEFAVRIGTARFVGAAALDSGSRASIATDTNGVARADFVISQPGVNLIDVKVPGTPLTAYVFVIGI